MCLLVVLSVSVRCFPFVVCDVVVLFCVFVRCPFGVFCCWLVCVNWCCCHVCPLSLVCVVCVVVVILHVFVCCLVYYVVVVRRGVI